MRVLKLAKPLLRQNKKTKTGCLNAVYAINYNIVIYYGVV